MKRIEARRGPAAAVIAARPDPAGVLAGLRVQNACRHALDFDASCAALEGMTRAPRGIPGGVPPVVGIRVPRFLAFADGTIVDVDDALDRYEERSEDQAAAAYFIQ